LLTPLQLKSTSSSVLLVAALLCGIISICFTIAANGIARSDDGVLHIYRSVLLTHTLAMDGVIYPRFLPSFAFGYGAGLFNFFSPLAYFPIVALQLSGLTPEASWEISLAMYLFLAQLGTYLLGRDITKHTTAGIIASFAYISSPYILLDLVPRGSVTELAALAFLPFVLYATQKLVSRATMQRFVGLLISLVFFVPLHNIIAVQSLLLLTPWTIFWLWRQRLLYSLYIVVAAVLLSFFATAFFWLPALGETQDVKISTITQSLGFIDATNHLRSVGQVFELGMASDAMQLQGATPISLSVLLLVIAILGLGVRQSTEARRLLLLLLGVVMIGVWLNTPSSAWIWKNVPFLNYSQFAWRILGVASLALALAAGLSFAALSNLLRSPISQKLLFFVLGLGILMGGYPWFYRPQITDLARTPQEIGAFEQQTGQIALSSYSEYLPRAARNLSYERLASRLAEADIIARLDPAIQVIQAAWSSLSADLVVEASTETSLVFDWLYMPGWVAEINDQNATVYAENEHGLAAIDIPSGVSRVHISRILTPLQQTAISLSLAAIFLTFPVARLVGRSSPSHREPVVISGSLFPALVLGLVLILLRWIVDSSGSSIFKLQRWQANSFQAENLHQARFDNGMLLLASTEADTTSTGQFLDIETFWTIHQTAISQGYSLLYQLIDVNGLVVAEENRFLIGQLPTVHWLQNHYIQDKLSIPIPPHTAPGMLELQIVLYNSQTLAASSWLNEQGNPQDARFSLDQVVIEKPRQWPALPHGQNDQIA